MNVIKALLVITALLFSLRLFAIFPFDTTSYIQELALATDAVCDCKTYSCVKLKQKDVSKLTAHFRTSSPTSIELEHINDLLGRVKQCTSTYS